MPFTSLLPGEKEQHFGQSHREMDLRRRIDIKSYGENDVRTTQRVSVLFCRNNAAQGLLSRNFRVPLTLAMPLKKFLESGR